jgi:hypothetical protein
MEKICTQFDDVRPIPRVAVRVWFADGTRTLGMWTGSRWWSSKGEIHPVKWELEVREKKTKKLRKKLRESEREDWSSNTV